jgi:hypothetical protein
MSPLQGWHSAPLPTAPPPGRARPPPGLREHRRLLLRWCHKAKAATPHGVHEPGRLPAVPERLAHGHDAGIQGGLLDKLPRPEGLEQLLLGDHAVTMAQEIRQDLKCFGAERYRLPTTLEFIAQRVQDPLPKPIAHDPPLPCPPASGLMFSLGDRDGHVAYHENVTHIPWSYHATVVSRVRARSILQHARCRAACHSGRPSGPCMPRAITATGWLAQGGGQGKGTSTR